MENRIPETNVNSQLSFVKFYEQAAPQDITIATGIKNSYFSFNNMMELTIMNPYVK